MAETKEKTHLRIGDKLVEIDHYDSAGKPVIKAKSETTINPDGSRDVVVKVPCLIIESKSQS